MQKILIIDDNDEVRAVLVQTLVQAGYQVFEAADGRQGVDLYRKEPTDLVITDIFMPEQDGLGTIMELRRDFTDARIIGISGGGRQVTIDYLPVAESLGAVRTLSKPFTPSQLLSTVRQVLGPPRAP